MNTFTVSIKQDGAYTPISGTPVFPFSLGELLDERLDEAYITVYGCSEEFFKPLTEVKVTVNDGTLHDYYFIVANDQSVELPVGSGKYKHQLYLIERTKLLEGVVCPTLTFTNSLGNDFSKIRSRVYAKSRGDQLPSSFSGYPDIISPISSEEAFTFPSVREVGESVVDAFNDESSLARYYYNSYQESVIPGQIADRSLSRVYDENGALIYTAEDRDKITIQPETLRQNNKITLDYRICYSAVTPAGTTKAAILVDFEIYTFQNRAALKPWSITDCFNRVLECAEPLLGDENPKYVFDGVTYVDGEIQPYDAGSLAEKYDKIEAPEFTLTQDTLREQLKVICSIIHAEPWLDDNNVIQLTEYGQQKRSNLSAPYVYKSPSYSINQYCTEVRSNAQNLVSSLDYARGVMIDPADDLYRSLRTDTAYTRINAENGIAETNQRIYSIQKVLCGVIGGTTDELTGKYTGSITGWYLEPKDITPCIFEATEYGANLSSQAGSYPYSKSYALYYTQGERGLKGMFFRAADNKDTAVFGYYSISNILAGVNLDKTPEEISKYIDANPELVVFQITYKPISNHFVSHGKQLYVSGETPYAQMYNQSENLTESDYFGENIKGVAARLGNVEEERTYYLPSVSHIPKVGEILDGYAISATSTEIMPSYIKCTVGLTKDFNRISQYVGINSIKRMYEVSERQAYQRDILVKATLLLSGTLPSENHSNFLFDDSWQEPYVDFLNGRAHASTIKSAALFSYYKNKNTISRGITLPVMSRALGNAITFSVALKDNYSAGQLVEYVSDSDIVGWWANDVKYTDYYGRIYWASVVMYIGAISYSNNETTAAVATTLPQTPVGIVPQYTSAARLLYHRLRKDNREIPSYNIELEAKTDQSDISIGSAFASLSPFVTDENEGEPELIIFRKSAVNVTKFDQFFNTPVDNINVFATTNGLSVYSNPTNGGKSLTFRFLIPANYKTSEYGWILRTPVSTAQETVEDEDGNVIYYDRSIGGKILLSSNDASKVNTLSGVRFLHLYITK